MGVCTKERKGVTAEVLMATPCTNSLGGRQIDRKEVLLEIPRCDTEGWVRERKVGADRWVVYVPT